MTEREPTNADNIAGHDAPSFEWGPLYQSLSDPKGADMVMYLNTVRPDGRPHSAGIGGIFFEGDAYLVMGLQSQKAKNLAANPNATLATRVPGYDVVVEGTVSRVSDPDLLERIAAVYRDHHGWPAQVEGDAFTAPFFAQTGGPAPWHVFRFRYSKVIALQLGEPGSAMRFRFD